MRKGVRERWGGRRGFIVAVIACAVLLSLLAAKANAAVATTADNGSDNLPFDFDYAAPVTWSVGNNGSYAGIGSVVTAVEGGGGNFLGTTMEILHGVNNSGSATIVSMAWRTRMDIEVDYYGFTSLPMQWVDPASQIALAWDSYNNIADVVDLHGMAGSYVLQSNYNENEIIYANPADTEQYLAEGDKIYLAWLEEVITDGELPDYYEWHYATAGNTATGTSPVSNFQGTFDEFLTSIGGVSNFDYSVYLGSYGVDYEDNVVWAVLNHNSIFGAVPEPTTMGLLILGGSLILARRRG